MANKPTSEKLVMANIRQRITFAIVESYKNTRTNVINLMEKKNAKTLAISSPNAAEGKSTTALNVAITISQLEKRVLIIDCDVHKPTIHKKLKIENNVGILDVILEKATLEEAIHKHNNFLDVITCNTIPVKSTELLNTIKFDEILKQLSEEYDYIIIDTPPINPVSDALVIAQKVDAIVLVIRAANTTHDAYKKAVKALDVLGVKVDGVIINGADPRPKGYYKSKYSYYKSGKTYY